MSETPDYKRVELVWPGKKTEVERVKLPFQVIERINDSHRSQASGQASMLRQPLPDWWPEGWRNKLIWGDNKYVLASLLNEFAGKVDLIYIDPPFATGSDFSFHAWAGQEEIRKQASSIEEKAYRDTWAGGISTYLQMIYERLLTARELLSQTASIYVHIDPNLEPQLRLVLDELFGRDKFVNSIVWKRQDSKSGAFGGLNQYGRIHEIILFYAKAESWIWNQKYAPYDEAYVKGFYKYFDENGRQFRLDNLTAPGSRRGESGGPLTVNGEIVRLSPGRHWSLGLRASESPQEAMNRLVEEGRISHQPGKMPSYKRYLDEMPGVSLQDVWTDIRPVPAQSPQRLDYDTQKPEALLERLIEASSNEGGLVLDFFCGSGTTMAVAEKLGRRWIGCDLGRFAIQTSRKRLLDIHARPFEVLNLGRYERKYWQGATAGEQIADYYRFIVELFHAQLLPGFANLHGFKAGHVIHVGATDAPVTETELRAALEECKANGFTDLDVLGWEWEMGLNRDGAAALAREYGVTTRLFNIPREVMDKRATDAGDVHFFELSVAELEAKAAGREAIIELKGFLPAVDDYMRKKLGDASLKWSDWIDYWSVDFEFDGETYINQWQAYRTRKNRTLKLFSDPHTYTAPGHYTAVVKVIDIFGNDTTQQLTVEIQ